MSWELTGEEKEQRRRAVGGELGGDSGGPRRRRGGGRRAAGGCCHNGVLSCVYRVSNRWLGAAGSGDAARTPATNPALPAALREGKEVWGGAVWQGGRGRGKRGLGGDGNLRIELDSELQWQWLCRTPARNRSILAPLFVRVSKVKYGGGCVVFIGVEIWAKTATNRTKKTGLDSVLNACARRSPPRGWRWPVGPMRLKEKKRIERGGQRGVVLVAQAGFGHSALGQFRSRERVSG
jgi:hypothetical protein